MPGVSQARARKLNGQAVRIVPVAGAASFVMDRPTSFVMHTATSFVMHTATCGGAEELAQEADLLVTECRFADEA